MRHQRCFLPSEVYFLTIRTVEERFALSPYACPGAWQVADSVQVDEASRQEMFHRGRACIEATEALTARIARAEANPLIKRPVVPITTYTDSIPNIIGTCLARGVKKFNIRLFGFVWMSNHGHLLVQAPDGNLADFMAYLNGQVAVNVNRFLGRRHHLWARRYTASQVLDEPEELNRLEYILNNPYNAGIASSIEDWAGLSSGDFFFQDQERLFLRFNRTAWHKSGRPDDIAPFLSTVKINHCLLPQLAHLDVKSIREKLRQLVNFTSGSASSEPRDIDTTSPIPRKSTIRMIIPTDRPESSKRGRKSSPQPLCHTSNPALRKLYREWHREFRVAYARASLEYRKGDVDVEFPPGSFAPSKYPLARHSDDPNHLARLHLTRRNLEIAAARMEELPRRAA
jgi:putative transposase